MRRRRKTANQQRRPGWLVLDRFVYCRDGYEGLEDDVTASEMAYTCSGYSLRVAEPPAVSRLYIHRHGWPEDIDDLKSDEVYAEVVTAHRGSILFKTTVPFVDADFCIPGAFPEDYFVSAAAHASAPLLHRRCHPLPAGGGSLQAVPVQAAACYAHGGDGEFTVGCVPKEPQWRIEHLELNPTLIDMAHYLYDWNNDAVLPLHDCYLCCVDYFKGIILIDVNKLSYFKYIPLPEEAMRGCRIDEDLLDHDPSRCVSVTTSGIITLVCIDKYNPRSSSTRRRTAGRPPDFFINSWSLASIHKITGVHNFTMESDQFWSLCTAQHQRLPFVQPTFPFVKKYFNTEECSGAPYWRILTCQIRCCPFCPPAAADEVAHEPEIALEDDEQETPSSSLPPSVNRWESDTLLRLQDNEKKTPEDDTVIKKASEENDDDSWTPVLSKKKKNRRG
uniref:DUF1618 domain-containing protein n=1 Tax=Leersia perrieri TaxID=77586 RepID=A0A0D9VCA8_9ORYZ